MNGREPEWVPHHGGPNPFYDADEPDRQEPDIMIRYRNGRVVGPLKPKSRRWPAWSRQVGKSDWDVAAWRLA